MHEIGNDIPPVTQEHPETQGAVSLSVIVPVFNEQDSISAFLDTAVEWDCVDEIVFVDAGSTDRTLEMLEGLTVLHSPKGRGVQCALGAKHASGNALVFVHCDSLVPAESMRAIYRALAGGVQWGSLTLRFTTNTPDRIVGSWAANARVRWTGVPFGDQTMFMTRALYDAVGGMPEIPIMEDYELSRRLKAHCWPRQLREKVYTSPRRFESGGNMRVMAQMRHLRHLYRKGVDINEISQMYGEGRNSHA